MWAVERSESGTYYHHVSNLSRSGLFLEKSIPMAVGRTMPLEIPLHGRTLHATGTVVHATRSRDACGIGVELALEWDEREAIDAFLQLPEQGDQRS